MSYLLYGHCFSVPWEAAINYCPHANSHHPSALEREKVTANIGKMTFLTYHPAPPRPTMPSDSPLSASCNSSHFFIFFTEMLWWACIFKNLNSQFWSWNILRSSPSFSQLQLSFRVQNKSHFHLEVLISYPWACPFSEISYGLC